VSPRKVETKGERKVTISMVAHGDERRGRILTDQLGPSGLHQQWRCE